MIEEKVISVNDLKYHYDTNHGFVMNLASPCTNESLQRMCQQLITSGITTVLPEFVVTSEYRSLIVVYPKGISFNAPEFYQKAAQLGQATGMWQLELLQPFLKSQ